MIRTPHPAYEPTEERNPWAGLIILAASFTAWAVIVLSAVQFAKWMGWI